MAGKYVLGRGGRTKMAIRNGLQEQGRGQGGGWEGAGGGFEGRWNITLWRVGLRNVYVLSRCLHQSSKNVNGSRPISVVGET